MFSRNPDWNYHFENTKPRTFFRLSHHLFIYIYLGEKVGKLRTKVFTQVPSRSNKYNNYKDIISEYLLNYSCFLFIAEHVLYKYTERTIATGILLIIIFLSNKDISDTSISFKYYGVRPVARHIPGNKQRDNNRFYVTAR